MRNRPASITAMIMLSPVGLGCARAHLAGCSPAVQPLPARFPLAPQEALLVHAQVIWIQINIHAPDQTVVPEFEDTAEAATRRFSAAPRLAIFVDAARHAFHDHAVAAFNECQRIHI